MTANLRSRAFVTTTAAVVLVATAWLLWQQQPGPESRPVVRRRPVIRGSDVFARVREILCTEHDRFIRPTAYHSNEALARSRLRLAPMRNEASTALRIAIMAATQGEDDLKRSNLEALGRLAKIRCPLLEGLKRIRLEVQQPVWTSQTFSALSSLPLTIRFPSGLNLTLQTPSAVVP